MLLKGAPLMVQHSQIKSATPIKVSHPLPGLPRESDGPVEASAVSLGFAEPTTAVSLLQDYPHCLPREADEQRPQASLLCFRRGQDQEIQQEPLQGILSFVSRHEVSAWHVAKKVLVGLQVTLQPS